MISSRRSPLALQALYPWLIVACGMLFYCYNYFFRSSLSVIQSDISQSLHISAYQFGLLTSAYYWAYTPMQIPAGMFYDKFGVRMVLCAASLTGVIGLYLFVHADTFLLAWLGRFIFGMGCAFAYIGTLKLASEWLPANRFATVAGLATAAGMTSGALTQRYISQAVQATGNYQHVLQPGVMIGLLLSIVIFLIIKDRPGTKRETVNLTYPSSFAQQGAVLKIIFSNPQMWLIGIIGCLLYLPASVFLDSYCKEFLTTVYNITGKEAVNISDLTFLGWIISGPVIGAYSDRIKKRCLPLTLSSTFAALLLCTVFYAPHLFSLWGLYITFFMAGFCCGGHPLCFPLGKENNPPQIAGTAIATTNAFIMLGGMIFPPLVGKLLDMHSTAIGISGLPIHDAHDYTFALSVIPIGVALGIALSFFVKETHCESQARQKDSDLFLSSDVDDDKVEAIAS